MHIANEELFFVDYDGDSNKKILYAPLRSYLALISDANMTTFLQDESSDVRSQVLEVIRARPLIEAERILGDLRCATPELAIPITDDCNFRCPYCHASAGEAHTKASMSESMIETIYDQYFKQNPSAAKEIKITFIGGGEPTFRFSKLKFAVRRAQEVASQRNMKCSFMMATNGFYGPRVRKFIVENFREVSLSFDGPAHIQNLHRPLSNGGEVLSQGALSICIASDCIRLQLATYRRDRSILQGSLPWGAFGVGATGLCWPCSQEPATETAGPERLC